MIWFLSLYIYFFMLQKKNLFGKTIFLPSNPLPKTRKFSSHLHITSLSCCLLSTRTTRSLFFFSHSAHKAVVFEEAILLSSFEKRERKKQKAFGINTEEIILEWFTFWFQEALQQEPKQNFSLQKIPPGIGFDDGAVDTFCDIDHLGTALSPLVHHSNFST